MRQDTAADLLIHLNLVAALKLGPHLVREPPLPLRGQPRGSPQAKSILPDPPNSGSPTAACGCPKLGAQALIWGFAGPVGLA